MYQVILASILHIPFAEAHYLRKTAPPTSTMVVPYAFVLSQLPNSFLALRKRQYEIGHLQHTLRDTNNMAL